MKGTNEIENTPEKLIEIATLLLKELIAIPSFSKSEDKTADHIEIFLKANNVFAHRIKNNIWATNKHFMPGKFTILLNSHHDTVKPNMGFTLDPYVPKEIEGKIYGLGSNDAGASLVSLLAVFLYFYEQADMPFNLIFAASAEEEISGKDGIEYLLLHLPKIDCGIVGEPTSLQMAVAEKGLLVLDCKATGVAGHASRKEGVNAIYKAMKDIEWFRNFNFPRVSELLGPVHMAVTSIHTENIAHNVIPDSCNFIVDIRLNDLYTFEEILEIIKKNVCAVCTPRSLRLKPGSIAIAHPLVQAGLNIGLSKYGSPTLSDAALMDFPVLKLGPGDSVRSHTANEFVYTNQIKDGIDTYIKLLQNLLTDQCLKIKS